MDMRLLAQSRDKLDASAAVDFIDSCPKAKAALVHASLKDEVMLLEFFQYLADNLQTPFAGIRVSGSATQDGYVEDAVAVAVLCGDFEAEMFHEKINFEDLRETVEKITPKFKGWKTSIIYASTTYKQNADVDFILRRINNRYPTLQIFGGASSPPPVTATQAIIEEGYLLCVNLKTETEFNISTGFTHNKESEEYVITKSDELHIYEINNKNAVEGYSRIQHIKPYFYNMITRYLLTRIDIPKAAKSLFKASPIIREGTIRAHIRSIGKSLGKNVSDMLIVTELDEKRSIVHAQSYHPTGTILKRNETTKEKQLEAYLHAIEQLAQTRSYLIMACAALPYWFEIDYKSLEDKLKSVKQPFLLSFVFGEYGAKTPYEDMEENIVHGGTVKALGFK